MAQCLRSPTHWRLGQDWARARTLTRVRGITRSWSLLPGREMTSLLSEVRGLEASIEARHASVRAAVPVTVTTCSDLAEARMEWRAVRPEAGSLALAGSHTEAGSLEAGPTGVKVTRKR